MGVVNRLANAFTNMAQRWVPDAYVIAIILSLIVFVFALAFGFGPEVGLADHAFATPSPLCQSRSTLSLAAS